MSNICLNDVEFVKTAVSMEQVIHHYGLTNRFRQQGSRLIGPCPIHKGNDPTEFRISIDKNTWNCLGDCKHGGNVLDFVAILENVTIQVAAAKAVEWFKPTGT